MCDRLPLTGLEDEKDANPFLNGVPGILEALRSGQIECRVYRRLHEACGYSPPAEYEAAYHSRQATTEAA